MWRRAVMVLALAAAMIGPATVGAAPAPAQTAGPSAPVPATPVFSLRRVPAVVAGAVADRRLATGLARIMENPELGGARERSCLSVRNPAGRVAYARNPDAPLIPASTTKVLTASAALTRLGPDFRYVTEVRAGAAPSSGTIAGDLWVVGAGDPLLATADYAAIAGYQRRPRLATSLEALADRVVATGVRRVSGRVVGDESRYDTQRYIPSWNPSYITENEIGPQSALTVNGGFTAWDPRPVASAAPATNAAATLTSLLRDRGVTIDGDAGQGKAPASATVVTTIESAPLPDVLAVLLRESDNLTAELLVKELGARFGGGGTTPAGLGVLRSTLASLGLAADDVASADGSGLDRSDRLTCDALQVTLASGGEQGVVGRSLPVAGRDGTLARRFGGTAAAGKVRAKTGSLEGVSGLSGWTTATDGRSLQFALIANELPTDGAGFGLQERVVVVLGGYPQAPLTSELAPLPAVASASPG